MPIEIPEKESYISMQAKPKTTHINFQCLLIYSPTGDDDNHKYIRQMMEKGVCLSTWTTVMLTGNTLKK